MAAEDEAQEQLLNAIRNVAAVSHKTERNKILWKSITWHCEALGLEIVKVVLPRAPADADRSETLAQENQNGKE